MNECPVCHSETKHFSGYEGYVLFEEGDECPHRCYSYEYLCGSSVCFISIRGHVIPITWGYTDTGQQIRDLHDTINLLIIAARKALFEDLFKLKAESDARTAVLQELRT